MCWALEPLLLASLVLHFDLETLSLLATPRRDLEVVKYENRMDKILDSGYKDILKQPFHREILSNSSSKDCRYSF